MYIRYIFIYKSRTAVMPMNVDWCVRDVSGQCYYNDHPICHNPKEQFVISLIFMRKKDHQKKVQSVHYICWYDDYSIIFEMVTNVICCIWYIPRSVQWRKILNNNVGRTNMRVVGVTHQIGKELIVCECRHLINGVRGVQKWKQYTMYLLVQCSCFCV